MLDAFGAFGKLLLPILQHPNGSSLLLPKKRNFDAFSERLGGELGRLLTWECATNGNS
jgi:hypothetical protein